MRAHISNLRHNPVPSIVRASLGVLAVATVVMILPPSTCFAQAGAVVTQSTSSVISAASVPGAENSISRVATGAESLHVVVGHSIFLNTKFRLRKVYIADPAILSSVTLSPNQIIVTAMVPGTGSLILLDETGQAQSYVISSDVDIQGLRSVLANAMRDDTVNVEGSGNRILLSGHVTTQAIADNAVKLATLYSKDVANSLMVVPEHPKQVRLKVRILEVDRTKLTQFGINLFNPGGNTSFLASTTTSQYPSTSTLTPSTGAGLIGTLTTSNPLNFLLYSTKLNLGTTIQDLESKQVLQILAEPTITTISGQKASFLAGGEFPFPMVQPGGSGTNSTVTIQFRPYGVKLEFTPIVNDDGTIRLKVMPEVSALDYTNSVTLSGSTIPALSTRRADTEVELRSNQSFAISGLLDQRTTDIFNKTPGAASIPIIGALFKSKNINHSTTELVVIVTPTLVDPLSEAADPNEPQVPIPTLNTNTFDKSLGKHRNPNPAAPPINPAKASVMPSSAVSAPADSSITQTDPSSPADLTPSTTAAPEQSQPAPAAGGASVTSNVPLASEVVATSAPQSGAPGSQPEPRLVPRVPATIRIMSFTRQEDAEAMAIAMKRSGYDVAVKQDPRDPLLHLQLGPFQNPADAEAVRKRLIRDGYNATFQ